VTEDSDRGHGATPPPDVPQDAALPEAVPPEAVPPETVPPEAVPPGEGRADDEAAVAAGQAARIAELEDQRLRALAEVENVRKRCASQVARVKDESKADVARQWLPVLDSLDLALQHADADPASIVAGIGAVRDQALGVLTRLGFGRREDLGTTFDPKRHEAVAARTDPQAPDGSIVEVVRPGYGDGETQLRPAQVVVARAE
jgi:molecular chaperone GrpE